MDDALKPIKLVKAFAYSLAGLRAAFRHERAFRQEVVLAIVLIPLAFWLGKSNVERALLVSSVILLLIVELINTAVETIVERISPEWHKLSGRAKDIGSASVLIALVNLIAVWICILCT